MSRDKLQFDDCRIIFRNFSGLRTEFNREGDRNFCLVLPSTQADQMLAAGWNVKTRPAQEEEIPTKYIQVKVSYDNIPPTVVLLSSDTRTYLNPETVGLLDNVEIAKVDLIITPYQWTVNGSSGIKAYLHTMYVTAVQNNLHDRYANYGVKA